MTEIVASILLSIGTVFTLIGSIGLVRLPDFYTRMHAPTKATTLGVSGVLAAAALTIPGGVLAVGLKSLVVIAFLFLTAPIGAHMMGRAARAGGIGFCPQTGAIELPEAELQRSGEGQPPPGPAAAASPRYPTMESSC
jgi:multicomponent K+:H+ antiporter subunit G